MTKLITVTEMMRSFSDIVAKVYYKGEIYNIKKGANIVARLAPVKSNSRLGVKDLNSFFKSSPHLDEQDLKDFESSTKSLRELQDRGSFKKWD